MKEQKNYTQNACSLQKYFCIIKKNKLIKATTETSHSSPFLLIRRLTWAEEGAVGDSQSFPTTTHVIEASVHIGPGVIDSPMNPAKTKINCLSSSRINISNKVNPRKAKQLLIAKSLNLSPVSIPAFTSMQLA